MKYSQKPRLSKKPVIAFGIAIALVLAAGTVYFVRNHQAPRSATTVAQPKINSADQPASQAEVSDSNDHKQQIVNDQNQQNTNQAPVGQKKTVSAVITSPGSGATVMQTDGLSVSSYVSGVFEDDGSCTLTASNGSKTVTKQTIGIANATTTNCPPFTVNSSELTKGNWTLTVGYSSTTANGTSPKTNIIIK